MGPAVRRAGTRHRRGHRRARRSGWPTSSRCWRARAGRRRASGSGPGRCSRPGPPSGSGDRRRPPCGAPPGSPTGGCPSRSVPTSSCWPRSAGCATSTGTVPRSTSAPSPYPLYLGHPARRPRTATGHGAADRRSSWPSTCARSATPGVGQVQVRFPARSVEELCDQIAAFGARGHPPGDTLKRTAADPASRQVMRGAPVMAASWWRRVLPRRVERPHQTRSTYPNPEWHREPASGMGETGQRQRHRLARRTAPGPGPTSAPDSGTPLDEDEVDRRPPYRLLPAPGPVRLRGPSWSRTVAPGAVVVEALRGPVVEVVVVPIGVGGRGAGRRVVVVVPVGGWSRWSSWWSTGRRVVVVVVDRVGRGGRRRGRRDEDARDLGVGGGGGIRVDEPLGG